MTTAKTAKTVQVRIRVAESDMATWERRGISTAADIRAAAVRAATDPTSLLPREEQTGDMTSWHVRFGAAELKLIDQARGEVSRSRWISDVVGRVGQTAEEAAAREIREATGTGEAREK